MIIRVIRKLSKDICAIWVCDCNHDAIELILIRSFYFSPGKQSVRRGRMAASSTTSDTLRACIGMQPRTRMRPWTEWRCNASGDNCLAETTQQ